jgi:hypothetical protein
MLRIEIATVRDLRIRCSLDDIPCIQLNSLHNADSISFVFPENCSNLTVSAQTLAVSLSNFSFENNTTIHGRVKIVCEFSIELCRRLFPVLQRCTFVELEASRDYFTFLWKIPVYYGQNISLRRLSLSLWENQSLVNLQKLQLFSCAGLRKLLVMPQLETLILEDCAEFVTIPTLHSLLQLTIRSCINLRSIAVCSNLKEVKVDNCRKLFNVASCRDHLNKSGQVTVTGGRMSDYTVLSNVSFSTLGNLSVTHLKGLGGGTSNYVLDRKTRILSNCVDLKDYSCCQISISWNYF